MKCAECLHILVSEDNLFFFAQSSVDVRLSLKPERKILVENCFNHFIDKKKSEIIQCKNCSASVGKLSPDHPLLCFGTEKIILYERNLTKKQKWKDFYNTPPYSAIEIRNTLTVTNNSNFELSTCKLGHLELNTKNISFADSSNVEHFYSHDLLVTNKTPREHQLLGFIQALLENTIIVLPTGSGKTLIAALLAARMKNLNPELMILFIVDRIPLVFQQGQVIKNETHLKVCCLCGENNTQQKKMRLREGYFDVLVVTAGALVNLINFQYISLSLFSCIIFDECHHATGNHQYSQVLDCLKAHHLTPPQRIVGLTASPVPVKSDTDTTLNRLRIVGLTASPVPVQSDTCTTLNRLKQLSARFFNASYYTYSSDSYQLSHKPEVIPIILQFNSDTQNTINKIKMGMDSIICKLQSIHATLGIKIEDWDSIPAMGRLRGILNSCSLWNQDKSNKSDISKLVQQLLEKCDELEVVNLIGSNMFESGLVATSNHVPSPRMQLLLEILGEATNGSKVIVFVSTHKAAEVVTSYLEQISLIKENFHPLKIVGHCGAFGMPWAEGQERVIREFSSGTCNLLVSTSVLEEGFDVPECDLVIRFDRLVTSLISYAQARGRARKKESKYVLILNKADARVLNKIMKNEEILNMALHQMRSSLPTQNISRDIFETTLNIHSQVNLERADLNSLFSAAITGNDCSIELYIETGSHDEQLLKDNIADTFDELFNLSVERIEVTSQENMKTLGIFLKTDTLVFLSLNSADFCSDYYYLCTHWDFSLTNIQNIETENKTKIVWSRIEVPIISDTNSIVKWGNVESLMAGHFENKIKFVCHYQRDNLYTLISKPQETLIILDDTYKIEISLTELLKFAIASWSVEGNEGILTLFLPLKSTPCVYDSTNQRLYATSSIDPLLHALSLNPVLGLTLGYDNSDWFILWKLIHNSKLLPVPLFNTKIQIQFSLDEPFNAATIFHPLALENKLIRDCLWAYSILCSNRHVCLPQVSKKDIYKYILSITDCGMARVYTIVLYSILDRLLAITASDYKDIEFIHPFRKKQPLSYWHNIIELIEEYHSIALENKLYQGSVNENEFGWNQCKIECAVITQSGITCLPPIICNSSRLLRKFSHLRILSIAFRDEQHQKLHDVESIDRIDYILKKGFKLHGCKFRFLACSNSQLRDQKALFVTFPIQLNAHSEIQSIRKSILGQTLFHEEAKYMSRLALFCTSDQPTIEIDKFKVVEIEDIKAKNGVLVTDGAGKIDRRLAIKVYDILLKKFRFQRFFEENIQPSALQIRLAGNKGILVVVDKEVDPDFMRLKNKNACLLVRPSMNKFDWTHSTLCIIKTSKFQKLHLNRDVITLLASLRDNTKCWNPGEVLKSLMQQALYSLADILLDKQKAFNEIALNLPNYFKSKCGQLNSNFNLIGAHFDVLKEPFWFSLVRLIYAYRIRSLTLKTHIPVANGALLIGIPDPFGVLQDNQVFVRYKTNEASSELTTLIGPLLVYRNPCLHPGDLLRLNAVSHPSLYNFINVIVFPITGSKSLPGSSGGGDLDGDEFSVIWDELLIPPPHCVYESLNYDEVADDAKKEQKKNAFTNSIPISNDTEKIRERLAEFYCRVVENESIGRVANLHLVVSDILPDGALDPIAIDLAKSQSVAVDYPKTGVPPKVPKKALEIKNKYGFPDFMEKRKEASYTSEKLLGELYRMCKSHSYNPFTDTYSTFTIQHKVESLGVDGSHIYLDKARNIYRFYCSEFTRILISFGIESEEEAILCMVIDWHPMVDSNRYRVITALEAEITELFEKFRLLFENELPSIVTIDDKLRIASAWYQVAYEEQHCKGYMQFLSFPWILGDLLCCISRTLNLPRSHDDSIGSTAIEYLAKQKNLIQDTVKLKMSAYPIFQSIIYEKSGGAFETNVFGSVSLFLCYQDSDLDISITPTQIAYKPPFVPSSNNIENFSNHPLAKQHTHFLENFISKYIDEVVSSLDPNYKLDVPLIRCTVESPIHSDSEIKVDIVVNSDGVQKAKFIQRLYTESGGIVFVWLWILVQWARQCGILKWAAVGNESGLLRSAEFHAFAMYIFNQIPSDSKSFCGILSDCTLSNILDTISQRDNSFILGRLLINFFTIGAKIANKSKSITYIWPIEGNPSHTIGQSTLVRLYELLFQAQQCLTFTCDINKLFESNKYPLVYSKNLSPGVSSRLEGGMQFHSKQLEFLSGANVQIIRIGNLMQVRGEGLPHTIQKLGTEVENLSFMAQAGKSYKIRASRYIMVDGLLMRMMHGVAESRVKLCNIKIDCFHLHNSKDERSLIILANRVPIRNWQIPVTEKIQSVARIQLARFTMDKFKYLSSLRFKGRFGNFYLLNCSRHFQSLGFSVSLSELEEKLRSSKIYRDTSLRTMRPGMFQNHTSDQLERVSLPTSASNNNAKIFENINKTSNKYINSSYCPGVIPVKSDRDNQIANTIYDTVLKECGFTTQKSSVTPTWKLSIGVSKTWEVQILMDIKGNIIKVLERPLVWLHATLIADRTTMRNSQLYNDIRFKIETVEAVIPGSPLDKRLFPNSRDVRPLEFISGSIPKVIPHFKDDVLMLKQLISQRYYKNGPVCAKIANGIDYSGSDLKLARRVCELTLYFHEEELRSVVMQGNNANGINSIVENAINISMQISNKLENTSLTDVYQSLS